MQQTAIEHNSTVKIFADGKWKYCRMPMSWIFPHNGDKKVWFLYDLVDDNWLYSGWFATRKELIEYVEVE